MYFLTLLTITVVVVLGTTAAKRTLVRKNLIENVSSSFQKNIDELKKNLPAPSDLKEGLDKKVKAFRSELVTVNGKVKDEVESTEKLSGAITSIGGSVVKFAEGYINGKWQDMVVGVLGVIGGIAALTGPIGALVSSVLSVISMVIGLFGGSQKAEESQESMLKRVITEALNKARAEELKADAEGLKKMMLSIRTSVNQFREAGNVSQFQAYEMYTQVFTGLDFFGKLKYEINKFCDITIEESPPDNKFEIYGERADKCLLFLNLYSDLSIYRMYLITDMASLFSDFNLTETANNLISLGEKERILDREILMFLYDPISNHRRRFCVSQYYAAPSKYKTIMVYSNLLHTIPSEKIPTKGVIVCSGQALLGVCHRLELEFKKNGTGYCRSERACYIGGMNNWITNGFESMFISDTFKVAGYSENKYKGNMDGFFYGPTVLGMIPPLRWKSIAIEYTIKGSQEMVRVCKGLNFDMSEACGQMKIYEYPQMHLKSIYFAETSIHSISIPDNVQVEIFEKINFEGNHYTLYGPNLIDDFCQKDKIKSVKISKHTKKVSDMVMICNEVSLSKQCDYLENNEYGTTDINGCSYSNDNRIKSMFIPNGKKVDMWTKSNFEGMELGPYIGPLTMNAVEGVLSNYSINSLKIT